MHEAFKLVTLIFFSVAPYALFLDGEFVFDDSEAIVKNKDLNSAESPWNAFHNDFWGTDMKSKLSHKSYRPLTVLSFRLNKYFDGDVLVPKHFKIVNLFLHCLVTLLFYKFVHCVYKYRRKNILDNSAWIDVPFLSSLLFAVHSVHVEAVSGIVGRADLLATLFFLLSILSYDLSIRLYYEKVLFNTKRIVLCSLLFLLCITFAILATLSKETGITVLCICGLYDLLLIQNLKFSDAIRAMKHLFCKNEQESEKKSFFIFILRILILFISFVIILFMRWAVMDFEGPKFQIVDNPAAFNESRIIRIITYNYIYFLNILLMIWPQWLCFDWSMGCVPLVEGFFDFRVVFVVVFWTFVIFTIFKMCSGSIHNIPKRRLSMMFGLMTITFLPASNIIMPVGFVVAERILYISSTGFCILVSQGFTNLLINTNTKFHRLIKSGFLTLICVMSIKTMERSKEWLNENSLYSSGVEVCPLNAKVHYNLAKNAADLNNFSLAEKEYDEAIRLHPGYYQAMNNLANLLKDQSRFSEAEMHLRNALKLKEDFPAAWMNLGIVLANLKQLSESENAYKKALMYRKKYTDCYYNLGNLYLDQNKNDLALKSWFEAMELNPKHVLAWSNTFALLDNTGRIEEALKLAPKALSILSHVPAIHFNLGNIFGKHGDFPTAEGHFKKAIELKVENIPAVYYANLGVLYHRWKKKELAIEMYKKALSINPVMKSAQDNLKKLLNRQ